MCTQTAIAFLIIAARKHYTLDVFTALYVVPMIWFLLEAYHKDINHKDTCVSKETMRLWYNIEIAEDVKGNEDEEESVPWEEMKEVFAPTEEESSATV